MRGVLAGLASPCPVTGKKLDPDALKSYLYLLVVQTCRAKVLCKLLVQTFAARTPEPQAFTAITSRYSDETTVSSSPPRLCADHSASRSTRNFRASVSSKEANARLVGP